MGFGAASPRNNDLEMALCTNYNGFGLDKHQINLGY